MRIEIADETLTLHFKWWERMLSAHPPRSLRVPIALIESSRAGAPRHGWRQLRVPGSFLPGVIKAGTYRWPGRKEFWLIHRGEVAITIDMKPGGPYTGIILGTKDPDHWVDAINTAVAGA